MPENNEKFEKIKLMYTENGNFSRYLIEWRHKIMTRFFITIAALMYIVKWMSENPTIVKTVIISIPFTLAGIVSIMFFVLDRRNHQLMNVCVDVGIKLEGKIDKNTKGYYSTVAEAKRGVITYTAILSIMYWGTAAIFFILAGYIVCLV